MLIPSMLVVLAATVPAPRVDVPRAVAPVVDGAIDSKEWEGSTRVPLNGGGEVLLSHDGRFVYLGFRGPKRGIVSVCTADGPTVRILHASAALGTAVFEKSNDAWRNTAPFRFEVRDTGTSPRALDARRSFLAADRWFGDVSRAGSQEREMQIAIPDGAKEIPLVLAFAAFDEPPVLAVWPKTSDACSELRLAQGYTDGEYRFDPKQWGVLTLR